jgi:hypothetical protein
MSIVYYNLILSLIFFGFLGVLMLLLVFLGKHK